MTKWLILEIDYSRQDTIVNIIKPRNASQELIDYCHREVQLCRTAPQALERGWEPISIAMSRYTFKKIIKDY